MEKHKIWLDYGLWYSFNQVKHALVHAPILAMPNFDANFMAETNASDIVIGAVLVQHNWPVACMSKVLNST